MVDHTQQPKPSLGKWKRIDDKVFEVTAVSRQRALEIGSWLLHAPADDIVIKPVGERPHYLATPPTSAKGPRKYRVSLKPTDGVFLLTVEGNAVFLQVDEARHSGRPVLVDQVLQDLGLWPVSGIDPAVIGRTIDLADWARVLVARLVIPPDAPANGVAILVPEDQMRAYALARGRAVNSPIARDEVEAALARAGVVAGILEDEIDAFLASRNRSRPVLVARGAEAVEGEPPVVTWLIPLVPGRHGEPVPTVEPGDVLAQVKPGKTGVAGAKVTGEAIPVAVTGTSDVLDVAGSGVVVSDDGRSLRAAVRGKPVVQDGNVVALLPVQTIDDVAGTIEVAASAVIRGRVAPGAQVRTAGDAELTQGVQDATIRSGGSIVVGGDVAGKSLLTAAHDILTMSVYGAVVKAGGTVRIRGEAVQATVWAGRRAVVSGRGRIDGGLVRAGEEIVAETIGNAQGRATRVVLTAEGGQPGRIIAWQAVLPGTIVRVGPAELEVRAARGPTAFEIEQEKIVARPAPLRLLDDD